MVAGGLAALPAMAGDDLAERAGRPVSDTAAEAASGMYVGHVSLPIVVAVSRQAG